MTSRFCLCFEELILTMLIIMTRNVRIIAFALLRVCILAFVVFPYSEIACLCIILPRIKVLRYNRKLFHLVFFYIPFYFCLLLDFYVISPRLNWPEDIEFID